MIARACANTIASVRVVQGASFGAFASASAGKSLGAGVRTRANASASMGVSMRPFEVDLLVE
eukprot:5421652-Alexandrium_andersonii.AAC.1